MSSKFSVSKRSVHQRQCGLCYCLFKSPAHLINNKGVHTQTRLHMFQETFLQIRNIYWTWSHIISLTASISTTLHCFLYKFWFSWMDCVYKWFIVFTTRTARCLLYLQTNDWNGDLLLLLRRNVVHRVKHGVTDHYRFTT